MEISILMPWFQKLMSVFGWPTYNGQPHIEAFERGRWPYVSSLGEIPADLNLTADQALSVWGAFAAVKIISQDLAGQPFNVYVLGADRQRTLLPDDDVAWFLNEEANPGCTAQGFREHLVAQALIHGNGYAEIVLDDNLRTLELRNLSSDRVRLVDENADGLVYTYRDQDGSEEVIPGWRLLHLPGPKMTNPYLGETTVGRAMRSIATLRANESYALNYFGQGTRAGGVLEVPTRLTPEEEANRKAAWQAERASLKNAHKDIWLPSGWKYTPIESTSAQDAQMIQANQAQVVAILAAFGVPAYRVGITEAAQGPYGRNLAEVSTTYVRNTLHPWKRALEQEVNRKLFGSRSRKRSELDLSALQLGDLESQAKTNEVLFKNGVISKNEWREEFGYNHIPDGDRYDGKPSEAPEPAAPTATSPDQSSASEGVPGDAGTALASAAVRTLLSSALDRHRRRVEARCDDLRRSNKNGVLEQKLAEARKELRVRALAELQDTQGMVRRLTGTDPTPLVNSALEAIENGGDSIVLAEAILDTGATA